MTSRTEQQAAILVKAIVAEAWCAAAPISDPDEAFKFIFRQMQLGGMRRLVQAVKPDPATFKEVIDVINVAGEVASASPHWPLAKELLLRAVTVLKKGYNGNANMNHYFYYSQDAKDLADSLTSAIINRLRNTEVDIGLTQDDLGPL